MTALRLALGTVCLAACFSYNPWPPPPARPTYWSHAHRTSGAHVYVGGLVEGDFAIACHHGEEKYREACRRQRVDVRATCRGVPCSGVDARRRVDRFGIRLWPRVVPQAPGELDVEYVLVSEWGTTTEHERFTVWPRPALAIFCEVRDARSGGVAPCSGGVGPGQEVHIGYDVAFAPGERNGYVEMATQPADRAVEFRCSEARPDRQRCAFSPTRPTVVTFRVGNLVEEVRIDRRLE